MPANFQSLPFTVSVRPMDDRKYGGTSALNCYLTMPFNKRARVEVENQGDNAYVQVRAAVERLCVLTVVLLHRLRALSHSARQRRHVLPRDVEAGEPDKRLGAELHGCQLAGDPGHQEPGRGVDLCDPGDGGCGELHRLQSLGHPLPERMPFLVIH